MERDRIIAELQTCDYLVDILSYHYKSGEHSFIAHWISSNRAYCGICGQCRSRDCGHEDSGLTGQVFIAKLEHWVSSHGIVRDSRSLQGQGEQDVR